MKYLNEKIKEIGIKAFSLLTLKENNLFDENLFISTDLLSEDKFINSLKDSGFQEGEKMFVRFSHPLTSIKLPKMGFSQFKPLYQFVKNNYKEDFTVIVHDFILGKYGGTITKVNDSLVMEFIEGGWNADYALNVDTAIFKNGISRWYIYQKKRMVPHIRGGEIKLKQIQPLTKKIVKEIFKDLSQKVKKLNTLLSKEFNSLEFLIDYQQQFKPIELQNIKSTHRGFKPTGKIGDVFELKTPHDLRRWDKNMKLLISIPADIDRADELMGIIKEIKNHTNHVYISYGILSHPAILLREAGISVERKTSNYHLIEIPFRK